MTDHDQNFKNLFLEYPREALQLFVPERARRIHPNATITPIREEMLKQNLRASFRRLDVPLLVEGPDGRSKALVFALEQETNPAAFSIERLAIYCCELAHLLGTWRVVPVVVFLKRGDPIRRFRLQDDDEIYLDFRYHWAHLASMQALQHLDSPNFVARVTLPTMRYPPERKLDVYAAATRGLTELEDDPNRQAKYADFIDIYADLSDDERAEYRERYPEEADTMAGLTERFTELGRKEGLVQGLERGLQQGLERGRQQGLEQGRQQGLEQGRQQGLEQGRTQGRVQGLQQGRQDGEAAVLVRQLQRRLGPLDAAVLARIQALPLDRLDALADAVFDLGSVGDLNRWLDGQSAQ